MTQVVQVDKNPFAEGAAVRVSRAAATPTLSTDTFTSWPQQGTKSHKLVATGTGAATVGMPNADRAAAAAAQVWSARATVRNGAAGSRSIALSIVFYDTAGATLGTALATTSDTDTFAAAEIRTLQVDGAVAPASTASVDVQVTRAAGGGAATSDPVHFDQVTLAQVATALTSKDPAADVFAAWSGTADASTQTYYTPELTATPDPTFTPVPRTIVLVDDLPPGVTSLTGFRIAEGRTFKIRGAIAQTVSGGFQIPVTEASPWVEETYRFELFADGVSVGYTESISATLEFDGVCIHLPEDPTTGISIDIADTSGKNISRPFDGEFFRPENRTLAVLHTGRRRGLENVELFLNTDDDLVAQRFEDMIGTYADDDIHSPVLCIRTPPFLDIPRTFYAASLDLVKKPITVHMGGSLREWEGTWTETAPPYAGLVVALLTRDDIDAYYSTRNAIDAAYSSRLAIDRDYSKAGTAP